MPIPKPTPAKNVLRTGDFISASSTTRIALHLVPQSALETTNFFMDDTKSQFLKPAPPGFLDDVIFWKCQGSGPAPLSFTPILSIFLTIRQYFGLITHC